MKQVLFSFVLAAAPFFLFSQLQLIQDFGPNPGNLDMYLYAPPGISDGAPVIMALHGCTQTAAQYAQETGWNTLADDYGFYVIYPEQKAANNNTRCFNWFEAGDINRGQGEARSIKAMLDYVAGNYIVDEDKIFVTGFSAGGGMTSVMLASYPELFAGGAILAGLPYKAAIGLLPALTAMNIGVNKTPEQWGELVRAQNPSFAGPWPRVVVFHGAADFTVNVANAPEIIEQWTNLHGTDDHVDVVEYPFDGNALVTRSTYQNTEGQAVAMAYIVAGMGHVVAVDPGTATGQGGAIGAYALDVNLYSSYRALEFWGLLEMVSGKAVEAPRNAPFKIYPNPAREWLNIELPGNAQLKLINTRGQALRALAGRNELLRLDIRGLAPGLYLVSVATPERTATQKLFIY